MLDVTVGVIVPEPVFMTVTESVSVWNPPVLVEEEVPSGLPFWSTVWVT